MLQHHLSPPSQRRRKQKQGLRQVGGGGPGLGTTPPLPAPEQRPGDDGGGGAGSAGGQDLSEEEWQRVQETFRSHLPRFGKLWRALAAANAAGRRGSGSGSNADAGAQYQDDRPNLSSEEADDNEDEERQEEVYVYDHSGRYPGCCEYDGSGEYDFPAGFVEAGDESPTKGGDCGSREGVEASRSDAELEGREEEGEEHSMTILGEDGATTAVAEAAAGCRSCNCEGEGAANTWNDDDQGDGTEYSAALLSPSKSLNVSFGSRRRLGDYFFDDDDEEEEEDENGSTLGVGAEEEERDGSAPPSSAGGVVEDEELADEVAALEIASGGGDNERSPSAVHAEVENRHSGVGRDGYNGSAASQEENGGESGDGDDDDDDDDESSSGSTVVAFNVSFEPSPIENHQNDGVGKKRPAFTFDDPRPGHENEKSDGGSRGDGRAAKNWEEPRDESLSSVGSASVDDAGEQSRVRPVRDSPRHTDDDADYYAGAKENKLTAAHQQSPGDESFGIAGNDNSIGASRTSRDRPDLPRDDESSGGGSTISLPTTSVKIEKGRSGQHAWDVLSPMSHSNSESNFWAKAKAEASERGGVRDNRDGSNNNEHSVQSPRFRAASPASPEDRCSDASNAPSRLSSAPNTPAPVAAATRGTSQAQSQSVTIDLTSSPEENQEVSFCPTRQIRPQASNMVDLTLDSSSDDEEDEENELCPDFRSACQSPRVAPFNAGRTNKSSSSTCVDEASADEDDGMTLSSEDEFSWTENNVRGSAAVDTLTKKTRHFVIDDSDDDDDSEESSRVPKPKPKVPTKRLSQKESKTTFRRNRDAFTSEAFDEFNNVAFDGLLSSVSVTWSNKLRTTAGLTKLKTRTQPGRAVEPAVRLAEIELSTKVLDSQTRLRATLLHEMCHAAAWIVDNNSRPPHGKIFKKWAKIAMSRIPSVEVTTTHTYEIEFKYAWACQTPGCKVVIKRHSRSLDINNKVCGRCRGRFVEIQVPSSNGHSSHQHGGRPLKPRKKAPPSEYNLFVQKNSKAVRRRLESENRRNGNAVTQQEVMKECAQLWHRTKKDSGGVP